MPSTDIVRQTIQYQDPRQSKLLNAHNKDNYGRHRGIVLYGMAVSIAPTPTFAPNTIIIGAGAIYSPFGTKVFVDISAGAENTIAVNAAEMATLLTFRPRVVAVVAHFKKTGDSGSGAFNPETPAVIDTRTALAGSAATVYFTTRNVAYRRDLGEPTHKLAALDPIGMVAAQDDTYSFSTENASLTDGGVSIAANEVLLAYIILGVDPATGVLATQMTDPGVTIVQCTNLVEGVAHVLGVDPLLNRNDVATEQYPVGAALSQTPSVGPRSGVIAMPSPHFGGPDDPTSWSTYKHPNFLRDGDSIVVALRRMDYVLRLWMDRTGDQELVGYVQDGTVAGLPARPTVDQIFDFFTGGSLTGTNNNAIVWEQPSDTSNLVLKDGVVVHAVPGVVSTAVDTHKTAIAALNRATWHLLKDVLGVSLSATEMRQGVAIDKTVNASLQFAAERAKTLAVTLGGAAETHYLYTETLFAALNALADRSRLGVSANMLLNPNMMRGTVAVPNSWSMTAATRTACSGLAAAFEGAISTWTVAAGGVIQQVVSFDASQGTTLISDILSGVESLGAALLCQTTATTFILEVIPQTASTSPGVWSIPIVANTKFDQTSFYGKLNGATGPAHALAFRIRNTGVATATIRIMGAAMGLGVQAAPVFDAASVQFMPRDGSVAAISDMDMGGHFINNVTAGVSALQAVNRAQLDAEAAARSAYDALVTLTDGSRPFTGQQACLTPVAGTSVANKLYVDNVLGRNILFTTPGVGSWTIPSGSGRVLVVAQGGAGGGGSQAAAGNPHPENIASGARGAVAAFYVDIPGSTLSWTIGGGGQGASATVDDAPGGTNDAAGSGGGGGGTTIVDGFCVAGGGGGGNGGGSNDALGRYPGVGGSGGNGGTTGGDNIGSHGGAPGSGGGANGGAGGVAAAIAPSTGTFYYDGSARPAAGLPFRREDVPGLHGGAAGSYPLAAGGNGADGSVTIFY